MEKFKVSQVAKDLGISPTAVYKKFKTSSELFQNHITKEKGITYVDREGFELVKNSLQKPAPEPVSSGSELVETLQKELDRKQGIIESLIAQQEAQRQRTDTILMKLTNDISTLQKSLEYKAIEPKPESAAPSARMNPEKENTPAPIRAGVSPKVLQKARPENLPQVQREVSYFEAVKLGIDDVFGVLFGRG